MSELSGKVAIVTGAGIGRGIAHTLAKYGADVVASDINGSAAEQVAGELKQFAEADKKSVDEGWEWFLGMMPLGRFQEPEDIGEMVAFLVSERARNITASAFNVAGGMGPV